MWKRIQYNQEKSMFINYSSIIMHLTVFVLMFDIFNSITAEIVVEYSVLCVQTIQWCCHLLRNQYVFVMIVIYCSLKDILLYRTINVCFVENWLAFERRKKTFWVLYVVIYDLLLELHMIYSSYIWVSLKIICQYSLLLLLH